MVENLKGVYTKPPRCENCDSRHTQFEGLGHSIYGFVWTLGWANGRGTYTLWRCTKCNYETSLLPESQLGPPCPCCKGKGWYPQPRTPCPICKGRNWGRS